MAKRKHPEQDFQAELVKVLALALPKDAVFFAVPNGGARSRTEAAILIGQGVKPGVPDLMFLHDRRAFGLELKAPKGTARGRISPAQTAMHEQFAAAGVPVAIARSIDEAVEALTGFGIPLRIKR
jgi:hypothetical protein